MCWRSLKNQQMKHNVQTPTLLRPLHFPTKPHALKDSLEIPLILNSNLLQLQWQLKRNCHPRESCRQPVWTHLSQRYPWQHLENKAFKIRKKFSQKTIAGLQWGSMDTHHPPISAFFKAGESLTPSPVTATIAPWRWHPSTMMSFCCGDVLANTISVWYIRISSISSFFISCKGKIKSNEDMILALAWQITQLSHGPEKFKWCNGIQTHDLCNTGAVL